MSKRGPMSALTAVSAAVLVTLHPTSAAAFDRAITFLEPELRVNHTVDRSQHHCSVGAGADGHVVVAYTSGARTGDVITRHLDGEEVILATSDVFASHPQVRTLGTQTWVAHTDIDGAWITEFGVDGSLAEPIQIAETRGLTHPQLPDFAVEPTGDQLLAVWNRKRVHIGTLEARMVGVDGRLDDVFQLGAPWSVLGPPAIVWTGDDAFLVAWSAFQEDGSNLLLGQQVVGGRPYGRAIPMTDATMSYHRRVKVALLGDRRAVFTWSETDPVTLASLGAYFSVVDERLTLLVSQVRVDVDRAGHQADVAGCAEEFVLAWDQEGDGVLAHRDVMVRLFSSDGVPRSEITLANTHMAHDQKQPDLFVDCDGGMVRGGGITWSSMNQDGDARGVYARWFTVE